MNLIYITIPIIIELIYNTFIAFSLSQFGLEQMIYSCIIMFILSIFLRTIPLYLYLIKWKSNGKFSLLLSSTWIIVISLSFYLFGEKLLSIFNFSNGLINFSLHLYKKIFMFSPLYGIYLFYLNKYCFIKLSSTNLKNHPNLILILIESIRKIIQILVAVLLIPYTTFSTFIFVLPCISFILSVLVLLIFRFIIQWFIGNL